MTKKQLQELVKASYTKDGTLNEEIVTTIANRLSRNDLKKYINTLKLHEQKTTIVIKSATQLSSTDLRNFEKEYSGKKIDYSIDSSLLLGVEVIEGDMVYNKNLKTRLENLASHVAEENDN